MRVRDEKKNSYCVQGGRAVSLNMCARVYPRAINSLYSIKEIEKKNVIFTITLVIRVTRKNIFGVVISKTAWNDSEYSAKKKGFPLK